MPRNNADRYLPPSDPRDALPLPSLDERRQVLIQTLVDRTYPVSSNVDLIVEGEMLQHMFVLLDGWGASYRIVRHGKRQILDLFLPGDIMGLGAIDQRRWPHSMAMLTRGTVAPVSFGRARVLRQGSTGMGAELIRISALQSARLNERIVSLGQRNAYQRLGHLLLELYSRLSAIGKAANGGFDLPINQRDIGDVLGLTNVHVSRTLNGLRRDRLIDVSSRRVTVLDAERLAEICDYRDAYLEPGEGSVGAARNPLAAPGRPLRADAVAGDLRAHSRQPTAV